MAEPVVQTVELTKRYGAQVAVDRLTLEVCEGEAFGFLGEVVLRLFPGCE